MKKDWEREVIEIAEYLGCNPGELVSEMKLLRKKDEEELIKILPETIDHHEDSCEVLEDHHMPCDCGVSHHNYLINKTKDLIKDYFNK